MSISSCFGCLDELTQVIYQSVHRFVILSSVTDDEWSVHVGLADSDGRWWRGSWSEDDVKRTLGPKASEKMIEAFAEKLKEAIVRGELYIGNWRPEGGTDINLTFDPGSKDAVQLPLHKVCPTEAAAYAANVFLEIALQAQTRGCRLHPSSYPTTVTTAAPPIQPERVTVDIDVGGDTTRNKTAIKTRDVLARSEPEPRVDPKKTGTSLDVPNKTSRASLSSNPNQKSGASLSNPNKKARKYKAIEFEDDE